MHDLIQSRLKVRQALRRTNCLRVYMDVTGSGEQANKRLLIIGNELLFQQAGAGLLYNRIQEPLHEPFQPYLPPLSEIQKMH